MVSTLIPSADLAPSVTSRVLVVKAIDSTEGAPATGSITFELPWDVDVKADGVILKAGRQTLEFDANGEMQIRVPTADPDTNPDAWFLVVKKSWAPHAYAIRVPVGTTPINLVDVPLVQELPAGAAPGFFLTGAAATVVAGDTPSVSTRVAGGVANFDFILPRVSDEQIQQKAEAAAATAAAAAIADTRLTYSLIWGLQPSIVTFDVVRGTPTYSAAGRFGTAISGANAVVKRDNQINEPVTPVTIECWFFATAPPTSGNDQMIWGCNHAPWLGVQPTTGFAKLSVDGPTVSTSTVSICDGAWHHLAVELRRVGGKTEALGFWVDGVPQTLPALGVTAAWNRTVTLRGRTITGYDLAATSRVDEFRVSSASRYAGAFTPPTAPFALDLSTILLAHLDSSSALLPVEGYPSRPAGAPGGSATYVGPAQPQSWISPDRWYRT